jgi:hypothetical protein
MKLKATDTIHVSSVKADNILEGEQFEVSDAEGARLVERGLAVHVKAAAKPSNKKAPASANKAAAGRAKAK